MPNYDQVHFGRVSSCYLFHNAIDLTWGPPVHRQTRLKTLLRMRAVTITSVIGNFNLLEKGTRPKLT